MFVIFEEHTLGEPESFPSEQAVLGDEGRPAIWQSAPPDRRACSGFQWAWVVKALLLCCVLQFVACDRERQPSPDVMDEVHLVEQRIVSSQDTLQGSTSDRKTTR